MAITVVMVTFSLQHPVFPSQTESIERTGHWSGSCPVAALSLLRPFCTKLHQDYGLERSSPGSSPPAPRLQIPQGCLRQREVVKRVSNGPGSGTCPEILGQRRQGLSICGSQTVVPEITAAIT